MKLDGGECRVDGLKEVKEEEGCRWTEGERGGADAEHPPLLQMCCRASRADITSAEVGEGGAWRKEKGRMHKHTK